jgi:multidrug efflux pump subunit AcrA (membrane-fusion protein)
MRLLSALLAIGLFGCHGGDHPAEEGHEEAKKDEEAHVSVKTEATRRGTVAQTVEALGRCEAIPEKLATLTPAVEGHVHALLVKRGETVKKGQPIVQLDEEVARADLAEKTASRNGLEAALELLKALPRPEERRANEIAIEQAKVTLERAKQAADRLRPLVARREVHEQQMLDADLAVTQARLLKETAEAQLQVMMIGPKPEAVAEAQARVKTADGLVEFSKAHLDYHTIRSPIDGILDGLTCHPGQTIAIGTPIGEVVDTRQILALVYLPSSAAQAVRVGQRARLWAADSGLESSAATAAKDASDGKVEFVGRIADPQTGNLPVHVLVENPTSRYSVGQTVGLSIAVSEKSNVLQVPASAILDLGEGPVLTVVRDGKTAILHPEVGLAQDGWVSITGTDLKEGEPVVVEGGYNLPEGTPVNGATEKAAPEKVARAEAGE